MYIGLKAGGDNKEYIRSPRPTAGASNRKRKASTTRNTTHDRVQPVRKRARTALQYEHYYHDDPDNDDTHEHLTGALPPSTSGADYARYDVGPSFLSTSQPPSYTTWQTAHIDRRNDGFDSSLQSNICQQKITNRNTHDMGMDRKNTGIKKNTTETRHYRKNTRTKNMYMNWNTRSGHKTTWRVSKRRMKRRTKRRTKKKQITMKGSTSGTTILVPNKVSVIQFHFLLTRLNLSQMERRRAHDELP